MKGSRVITRISERGTPMGDIRDLLVKGEVECQKDSATECNSYPTEEGKGGSWT